MSITRRNLLHGIAAAGTVIAAAGRSVKVFATLSVPLRPIDRSWIIRSTIRASLSPGHSPKSTVSQVCASDTPCLPGKWPAAFPRSGCQMA
jgi:hypothetical protein